MERSRIAMGLSLSLFVVLLHVSVTIHAETITIPIADLRGDISTPPADDPTTALNYFLAKILQEQLQQLGFRTDANALFGELPLEATTEDITSLCLVPMPKTAHTDATIAIIQIDDTSQFQFELNSLDDITLSGNLSGNIVAETDAWVRWGQAVPFVGNCQVFTTDHGSIKASVSFTMSLSFAVSLTPSFNASLVALVVDKQAQLTGSLDLQGGSIEPDFGGSSLTNVIINAFERQLLNKLRDNSRDNFNQNIATLNLRLQGLDADGNLDPTITPFNEPSVFVLEQDPQAQAVLREMLTQLGIPDLVISLLNERGIDILLTLATLDQEVRDTYIAELGAQIGCEALHQTYARDLLTTPIYQRNDNLCVLANLAGADLDDYYTDSQCQQPVAFRPSAAEQFCTTWASAQQNKTIGNAAAWQADLNQPNDPLPAFASQKWTQHLTTRMDIGVVPLTDNQQPFVKLIHYKTEANIPRGNGECALEMQVYKNDINAENLQPLLAIHGGTWKGRGFSVFGLQASISHFTQQGFIVFVPFYRLVDTSDANTECNGATWREVTTDIEDALRWVLYYGDRFGMAPTSQVSVFGQSAGAHLATWLATHRPDAIRKAMLFYPPFDVLDFVQGSAPIDGPFAEFREFGLNALATLYGAQAGYQEFRLTDLDVSRLDPRQPLADFAAQLPNSLFDLSQLTPNTPPLYLHHCASSLGMDLLTTGLTPPPPALQACLMHDAAEFLIENSFYHQLADSSVPLFIVHGSSDTLVPYAQAIKACSAIDGQPRPFDITTEHTLYQCGENSEVHILQGAEHALDLGLCFGPMCPAGAMDSTLRQATAATVQRAYQWLGEPMSVTTRIRSRQYIDSNTTDSNPRLAQVGSGSISLFLLLLFILILRRWQAWPYQANPLDPPHPASRSG